MKATCIYIDYDLCDTHLDSTYFQVNFSYISLHIYFVSGAQESGFQRSNNDKEFILTVESLSVIHLNVDDIINVHQTKLPSQTSDMKHYIIPLKRSLSYKCLT